MQMVTESGEVCFLTFISMLFLFVSLTCSATDTLSPSQSIKDGQTLTSKGKAFHLGFFSPGNSSKRYVGTWYEKNLSDRKVVWVANRENPVMDSSGVLIVNSSGNLVLLDGQQNILWWSTNSPIASSNSMVVLLDTGNLVLTENNSTETGYLWQSFDYPSDTFLQGVKLTINSETDDTSFLTSWKNEYDPSPGRFIMGIYNSEIPQAIVWNGSVPYWRSGQWNGNRFVGIPTMYSNYLNGYRYIPDNHGGGYFSFSYVNTSSVVMYTIDSSGSLKKMVLSEGVKEWIENWKAPENQCDIYGKCGSFGSCNSAETPICKCLSGFEPNVTKEWSQGNWTSGCMRRTQLQCKKNSSDQGKSDGFIKLEQIKLPDFSYFLNVDVEKCEDKCLRNCSCIAYSYASNIGCLVWDEYLIDIQEFAFGGEELFLRLAHLELGNEKNNKLLIILVPIVGIIIFGSLTFTFYWLKTNRRRKQKRESLELFDMGNLLNGGVRQTESLELPLLDFGEVAFATNNFSDKLGEGGFGPVYKGKLQNAQEIAVKRLSRSSGQGIEEFKNEIMLISKLQHRNLVRLLGYCVEGEERMLLYEYLPNRSLDVILFDATRRTMLDWSKRFNIVDGIARGLLYLHHDSRLRVIHRDLKASNILLDEDMNPKISDFGMARIFGGKQIIANTNRIVGTYGYMSPEYAMEGIFSEKSDVYSFGVLLLEIVSSKRCTGFYHHEQSLSFLGFVWQLWSEGKALELMDQTLVDSYSQLELMRCIHVGLLCVQEHAVDRLNMSTIVSMLGSEATLPTPKQPGFTLERRYMDSDLSSHNNNGINSINSGTVTSLKGR